MNPFEHVPAHIVARLDNRKPYTLLILYKTENYSLPTTQKIIQSEHLPYLFDLREKGIVLIAMPVMDAGNVAAIAVYNSVDKEEVKGYIEKDPAVMQNIFTYEILSAMGMKGDSLK
jgi:hypothetical protein